MEQTEEAIAFDRSGQELTVYLVGELDAETAPGLSRQISERAGACDGRVWLDLSGVTFCGSAGVSLIIRAHNEALDRGSKAIVFCPSEPVVRLLEMCNLSRGLNIRTS